MKLNPDCIRSILLEVEAATDSFHSFRYQNGSGQHKKLDEYTANEILYHVRQCKANDLIESFQDFNGGDTILISDLTPKGHEFLAKIRSDTIWNNTKNIAGKIGTKSLDAMIQIATAVLTEIVKAQIGLM